MPDGQGKAYPFTKSYNLNKDKRPWASKILVLPVLKKSWNSSFCQTLTDRSGYSLCLLSSFYFGTFFWEREKTNSTTITQWCIGRFYHLFAPRNNTLHRFCLINPKVLTKTVGIKNITRSIPNMSHPPPPSNKASGRHLSFFFGRLQIASNPR